MRYVSAISGQIPSAERTLPADNDSGSLAWRWSVVRIGQLRELYQMITRPWTVPRAEKLGAALCAYSYTDLPSVLRVLTASDGDHINDKGWWGLSSSYPDIKADGLTLPTAPLPLLEQDATLTTMTSTTTGAGADQITTAPGAETAGLSVANNYTHEKATYEDEKATPVTRVLTADDAATVGSPDETGLGEDEKEMWVTGSPAFGHGLMCISFLGEEEFTAEEYHRVKRKTDWVLLPLVRISVFRYSADYLLTQADVVDVRYPVRDFPLPAGRSSTPPKVPVE